MLNILRKYITSVTKSEDSDIILLEISVGPLNLNDLTEELGDKLARHYCERNNCRFSHQSFVFENARKTRIVSRSYVIFNK